MNSTLFMIIELGFFGIVAVGFGLWQIWDVSPRNPKNRKPEGPASDPD
jgi:hypothetical protein